MIKSDAKVKSICILRLSAIGDVTHVLPVIATLQKAYPHVEITWVIGKLEYKLMQGLVGVKFVIFDKREGRKAYKELKHKLKNQTFDVLMQMQYSFRANRAAWKIKAINRIGFDKERSRELHGFKLTQRIKAVAKQHVLDSFMEFVKVLGITDVVYEWKIPTSESDNELVKQHIHADKKNVIISPCSSVKLKNWSDERYAHIINYLIERFDVNVILCGGPSEYELQTSSQIEQMSKYPVTNITGKDTLKQLFALMKIVDLVISPDSGPMHMASAAGTPVIGLHATSTAKRSGPYRHQDLVIDCFEQAAQKFLHKSADKIRWGGQVRMEGVMDLITTEMVEEKIDRVFA
ncbi:MAG: glycosyltransferase family 9 protein [Alcanivoracaceae bacterium]|nr:glycosyltransferase family 9 protein [Alcanivoracaceae bacterium]